MVAPGAGRRRHALPGRLPRHPAAQGDPRVDGRRSAVADRVPVRRALYVDAGGRGADGDRLDRAARHHRPLRRRLPPVPGSMEEHSQNEDVRRQRVSARRRLQRAAVVRARDRLGAGLLGTVHRQDEQGEL